jgi:hypothetical protein
LHSGVFGVLIQLLAGFALGWVSMQSASAGEAQGFAVSWFQPDFYYGDGDCPDGVNPEIDWKAVFLLEGKSAEEIARLIAHPNSLDYRNAAINRGPHGENVCAMPTVVPDPGLKTVQGRLAYGLNLDGTEDGAATAKSCKHEKFVSPDGVQGIDNQLYRVMGCSKSYRGKDHSGFVSGYINERMRTEGMRTYLIEITGMKDPRNDDDVEVGFYVGADPLVPDSGAGVQFDTTQRINKDPRWRNLVHGRIKDGVLTTDVFELNLLGDPMWVPEFHFRSARLRLELLADGTTKGVVGGYLDIPSLYFDAAKSPLTETLSSGNCPATYYAFKRMADGYPDPKTGECDFISTAFAIEAVPAFLVHPPSDGKAKTAQAGQGTDRMVATPSRGD